jgi:hypothetical protein
VIESDQYARIAAQIPIPYRQTLEGALRAARNPAALLAEIEGIANGLHPPAYDYATIGQALHELAVAGGQITSRALRGFCRKIRETAKATAPKPKRSAPALAVAEGDRPTGSLTERFQQVQRQFRTQAEAG